MARRPAADADSSYRNLNEAMHRFAERGNLRDLAVYVSGKTEPRTYTFRGTERTGGDIQGSIYDPTLRRALDAAMEGTSIREMSAWIRDKFDGTDVIQQITTSNVDDGVAPAGSIPIVGRIRVRGPGNSAASVQAIDSLAEASSRILRSLSDRDDITTSRIAASAILTSLGKALTTATSEFASAGVADMALAELLVELGFGAETRNIGRQPAGVAVTHLPANRKLATAVFSAIEANLQANFIVSSARGGNIRGTCANDTFALAHVAISDRQGLG